MAVSLTWLPRRLFELSGDETTEGWRKLHNEKLPNLFSSLSKIRINQKKAMNRSCRRNKGSEEGI
jgi:hypothetical protein